MGPLNSTSYKMMMQGNIAESHDLADMMEFTGVAPRSLSQGLSTEPLTVQSLWHARLFFLKPVLRIMLGLFWIMSGVIAACLAPELGLHILHNLGLPQAVAASLLYASCLTDVVLGMGLIFTSRTAVICSLQILCMAIYTIVLTGVKPDLWLDPLGALLKNIPIMLLTLVLMAIEKDK